MKQIAQIAAVGVVAFSVAGCAVEVPMSAFRAGPLGAEQIPGAQQIPGAEQAPAPQPQPEHHKRATQ